MNNFGVRLKNLRLKRHLTQAELADLLSVTKSVISAYEHNLRMPSYDILIHISRIFDVSTDYLLCNDSLNTIDLSGMFPAVRTAVLALLEAIRDDC